jgi:hypothetical protein
MYSQYDSKLSSTPFQELTQSEITDLVLHEETEVPDLLAL